MPIIKSAKKAVRSHERKRVMNQAPRKAYKSTVKSTRENFSVENLSAAFKALDKAAKRRVIHPNKASRLKSRLAKLAPKKAA